MRKNILICSLIAILLIAICGAVVVTANNYWGIFKKEAGIIRSQQGILISDPVANDKQELIDSIDPKTGQPTKEIDYKIINGQKEVKKMLFNHDGKSTELTFSYVKNNGMYNIINEPGKYTEQYFVTQMPKSKKNIIEFNDSIYLLDIENSSISKLLKDEVDGYDIKKAIAYSEEKGVITWASNPSFNLYGTKMVFYTQRNVLKDGDSNGEFWVKDLLTGDEKFLCKKNFSVLGWDTEDNLYVDSFGSLEKINANNGESRIIVPKSSVCALSYPYILYQVERGHLNIVNLVTNKETEFKHEALYRVGFFRVNKEADSPWILMLNIPESDESLNTMPKLNVVFLNLKTMETKVLPEPSNSQIRDCNWMGEGIVLVNVWDKSINSEITYTININGL